MRRVVLPHPPRPHPPADPPHRSAAPASPPGHHDARQQSEINLIRHQRRLPRSSDAEHADLVAHDSEQPAIRPAAARFEQKLPDGVRTNVLQLLGQDEGLRCGADSLAPRAKGEISASRAVSQSLSDLVVDLIDVAPRSTQQHELEHHSSGMLCFSRNSRANSSKGTPRSPDSMSRSAAFTAFASSALNESSGYRLRHASSIS